MGKAEPNSRISVQAGPKSGQQFDVTEALTFTLETAKLGYSGILVVCDGS